MSSGGGRSGESASDLLALRHAVTTILTESPSAEDALPLVLQAIGDRCHWPLAAYWTADSAAGADGALHCAALWHEPAAALTKAADHFRRLSFAAGAGLPGRVWADRRPVSALPRLAESGFSASTKATGRTLRWAVGFPVGGGKHFHGVIVCFSSDLENLSPDVALVLSALGWEVGGFLDRMRAGQARRLAERHGGAIFETALEAIVIMNAQGQVVEFNPVAERMFGYARAEAVGQELAALIVPPDAREHHRQGLARYLATGVGPLIGQRLEVMAMRADHSLFPAELAITDITADGPPLFTGYIRDLTERAQAEKALRASEAALREANRRMDEFLGIAGHEMRTPLTTISGHVQLAIRRLGRLRANDSRPLEEIVEGLAGLQRSLDRAEDGLTRLNQLVADLLDVSRIEAGQLSVRLAPCDLAVLVHGAVDQYREMAAPRPITLSIASSGPLIVAADEERIGQVVSNYLSNALKYSPSAQPVTVGLEVDGVTARVWVRDAGPGVAAADRQRIWDRFYRVPGIEPLQGSNVGLGLGLHICRSIIERHGGHVGVDGAPGEGATFWFSLPLQLPI